MSDILDLKKLKALAESGPVLNTHPVPVYEWGPGRCAYIAELTADERDARLEVSWLAYKAKTGQENNVHFRAWLAAACWCNQDRSFIANDAAAIEEAAALFGAQDGRPVTRMSDKAAEVNALSGEAMEELEKNLQPAGDESGKSPLEPDTQVAARG